MIVYIIKSCLCLILLLAIYLIFLESEKMHQFNRFFLLGALVLGLTVPFINFEFDVVTEPDNKILLLTESFETSSGVISAISRSSSDYIDDIIYHDRKEKESGSDEAIKPDNQSEKAIHGNHSTSSEASIISPIYIFIIAYATVEFILLYRMLFGLVSFYTTRRASRLTNYGSATLALVSDSIVPHTFLNTIYVNKDQFESGELSKQILDHELTHAKQKHSLDVLLIEILRLIFWFNPVFYFYKRAIQINHEFLADESVIKNTQDSVSYQKLLLGSIFSTYKTSMASSFNYSLTKKRFKMMKKEHSKLAAVSKKMLLIPLLACTVFVFCTDSSNEKKEYKIDGVKYISYSWEGFRSNEPILARPEDVAQTLNLGARKYYDREGNLFTGEWILYHKDDENKVSTRSEIKEGKLLTRVQYVNQEKFSVMRTSYISDTVSTAMFSSENKLVAHNTITIDSSISPVLIQAIDTSGVWGEHYFIGSEIDRDSLKDVTLGIKYDTERNIEETYLLSNEGEIPLTNRYKEVATVNAKKIYDSAVSEYQRLIAKGDKEQVEFAYQELKHLRSRWLAFRREFYKNKPMLPIAPLPDPPSEL